MMSQYAARKTVVSDRRRILLILDEPISREC